MRALVAAIAMVCLGTTAVTPQNRASLTVIAEGVNNTRGVVGVLVFKSSRGWPESPASAFARKDVPAQVGRTVLEFAGLPPGDYAVVVLHDENKNMKLDRNWFGKPREQWGMSNNPKAWFSAPSFDEARFRLDRDLQITVRMN